MKTNLFSLATVVLASVASVVSMSSCSKSDDPYVIDNPTPRSIVQSTKQAQTQKAAQAIEVTACGISEELQYFDFIATTQDGQSYKITTGGEVAELGQKFGFPICNMQVADFHPTSEYTPVTITLQVKDGVTLPETLSFMFRFYKDNAGKKELNSGLGYSSNKIQSEKINNFKKVLDNQMKYIKTSIRKDGKIVAFITPGQMI